MRECDGLVLRSSECLPGDQCAYSLAQNTWVTYLSRCSDKILHKKQPEEWAMWGHSLRGYYIYLRGEGVAAED